MRSPEIGQNTRSTCGRGRVSYRPDFSSLRPFSIYFNGTAVNASATLGGALQNLESKGCIFPKKLEWT